MTRSDFSGLAAVKQPNDWTEVTLPHAETDDRADLALNCRSSYFR
jgi:hypothetical protein